MTAKVKLPRGWGGVERLRVSGWGRRAAVEGASDDGRDGAPVPTGAVVSNAPWGRSCVRHCRPYAPRPWVRPAARLLLRTRTRRC
ncbi:Hypothetical protein NTJ_06790 [Nesidiocoris tenuis]|uniref:Uncharacterized protein n=1 Tax=Nesidiocoris tenuis TaxID=355587 RepID=A0ABN7AP34_9HEMI|nr:Hypothetical protein NTJ_06790 [Nesidiocoris tenuis]